MNSVKKKDKSYFDIIKLIRNSKRNHRIALTLFIILLIKLIRSQNQFHLNHLEKFKKKDQKNKFSKIKFKKIKIIKNLNIKKSKIKYQILYIYKKTSL